MKIEDTLEELPTTPQRKLSRYCPSCTRPISYMKQAMDVLKLWRNGDVSGNVMCYNCGTTICYVGVREPDKSKTLGDWYK